MAGFPLFAGGQSWVSPREPHKAAANDPHFLCTDGQLLWANVSRGEGPCLDFQATFQ